MFKKYYDLISDGNDKVGGVLIGPKSLEYPMARDGKDVTNWQDIVVKLEDGKYCPMHLGVKGANVVDDAFKELIESFIGDVDYLEFLPIKAVSPIYGEKRYYILHFKKIFDVVDKKHSVYIPGTKSLVKLAVDKKKVEGLHIFNSSTYINAIIVSEELFKAIKKNKLYMGLDHTVVPCYIDE